MKLNKKDLHTIEDEIDFLLKERLIKVVGIKDGEKVYDVADRTVTPEKLEVILSKRIGVWKDL